MFRFLFIFFFFPILLSADFNPFDDEDPTLYHHVNVISGHLNFSGELLAAKASE